MTNGNSFLGFLFIIGVLFFISEVCERIDNKKISLLTFILLTLSFGGPLVILALLHSWGLI